MYFPSFSEGLSLRVEDDSEHEHRMQEFPFLFGGTFIEGGKIIADAVNIIISLPFRRDFH